VACKEQIMPITSTAHASFPAPDLDNSQVAAQAHTGLQITTADGRLARLAIIDEAGNVLDVGQPVADACWQAAVTSYRNMLIGQGHIRVLSKPAIAITEAV
jgi:hypothetical protein